MEVCPASLLTGPGEGLEMQLRSRLCPASNVGGPENKNCYSDFRELIRNQENGCFFGFSTRIIGKGEMECYCEGSQLFGTCPNGQNRQGGSCCLLPAHVQAQKGTGSRYQLCQPDSYAVPAPWASFKQYLPHSPGEQTLPYHFYWMQSMFYLRYTDHNWLLPGTDF